MREITARVPVVVYQDGRRDVVGIATIGDDNFITAEIDPDFLSPHIREVFDGSLKGVSLAIEYLPPSRKEAPDGKRRIRRVRCHCGER